jgi:hypothetical protein
MPAIAEDGPLETVTPATLEPTLILKLQLLSHDQHIKDGLTYLDNAANIGAYHSVCTLILPSQSGCDLKRRTDD